MHLIEKVGKETRQLHASNTPRFPYCFLRVQRENRHLLLLFYDLLLLLFATKKQLRNTNTHREVEIDTNFQKNIFSNRFVDFTILSRVSRHLNRKKINCR